MKHSTEMKKMRLSEHFTLSEFTASDTALRLGVDNSLPPELLENARSTVAMLEIIRAYLSKIAGRDVPLIVTSGYRCAELNRAIGSRDSSDHRSAQAADFKAPAFGTPLEICQALIEQIDTFGIGQLIYENTWVHVSTRPQAKSINRVLTASGRNFVPGIVA